jgi:hypothetical protein
MDTVSQRRIVTRYLHEEALQRMQQRATPDAMRLRQATVEHPFANLKYRIFGHPRFLLRGLRGAQNRNQLGRSRLQSETHAEHSRRTQTA